MVEPDGNGSATASALFELFDGRRDCYGKGKGLCVKQPVTEELIARHLAGELAIGVYPLTPDGNTRWACVDLDLEGEPELAQWAKALGLYESLRRRGCCPFIERSKSKGYHCWVFYREPVEASWARQVAAKAIADAGLPPDTEIFPKQDRLDAGAFGNYVNLPYFGPNGDGRRVMVNPADGKPWSVDEFLAAHSYTDPDAVLVARDSAPDDDDVIIAGGGDAARLLGEDAPYKTRHEKGKRVIGLLAARLWPDGEQAVLDAALCWNTAHCGPPPLPEAEVKQMVRDFWKKEEKKRAKEGVKETAKTIAFHTAREVAEETPEAVEWLAPPWVAASAITELTGKAKASGKTTLTMHMIAACLDGGEFLGQQTARTPVVYLTEERPATLREALARAGLLERDDLFLMFWHDTVGVAWPDVVAVAVAKCQREGARLLIVDTLSQFASLQGDDESAAGAALDALRPLQAAAAQGLGIWESRHERKSGGAVGESGRGSSAFAGAADVVLKLSRAEGAARPTIRKIEALSRFSDTPETLVIELVNDSFDIPPTRVGEPNETKRPPSRYVALGTETAVALATAKQAVLDILPASEPEALERKQIEAGLPDSVKAYALTNVLRELRDSGDIHCSGEGKRGNPYKYWKKGLVLLPHRGSTK